MQGRANQSKEDQTFQKNDVSAANNPANVSSNGNLAGTSHPKTNHHHKNIVPK